MIDRRFFEDQLYSPSLEDVSVEGFTPEQVETMRQFVGTRVKRSANRAVATTVATGALEYATGAGITWLGYGARGALRFIPILGWGLLAYDLYNLGEDLEFY